MIGDQGIGNLGEATVGGGVAISGGRFGGAAIFQDVAGVAQEGVLAAVEGAAELVSAVVIEVVVDEFAGELEGGGVVAVSDLALVDLGDGGLATVGIVGDGDVGGGIAVVGESEEALGVGGGDFGIGVFFANELWAGGLKPASGASIPNTGAPN